MPAFTRRIGIDYSGAQTPTASLKGVGVYLTEVPAPAEKDAASAIRSKALSRIAGWRRAVGEIILRVAHQLAEYSGGS